MALIIGDNRFNGHDFVNQLNECDRDNTAQQTRATVFAYPAQDPERYGVVEFDRQSKVLSIKAKPAMPRSQYAVTGLYFHDDTVIEKTRQVEPSKRGELEIADLNSSHLADGQLKIELVCRCVAWLDTGICDSLHEASSDIRTLEHRQGLEVGCPGGVAWGQG